MFTPYPKIVFHYDLLHAIVNDYIWRKIMIKNTYEPVEPVEIEDVDAVEELDDVEAQELESYFKPQDNIDDEIEVAKILNRIEGEWDEIVSH